MRRAARVDANQAEVFKAFRKLGCSVWDTSRLGGGFPDCVLGYGGVCITVEIKDGSKPPSARKLTPAEIEFRDTWKGGVRLVQNLDDVQINVGLMRRWHRALCADATKP